jgi:hypothetical protein
VHPASFLTRKWRLSARGNLYLRLQGIGVVLFRGWPGPWYFQVAGEYSRRGFPTEREAKLAAYEAFQEALLRRGQSGEAHGALQHGVAGRGRAPLSRADRAPPQGTCASMGASPAPG